MTDQPLETDPYKGVRDFYPDDFARMNALFDEADAIGDPVLRDMEIFNFVGTLASLLDWPRLPVTSGTFAGSTGSPGVGGAAMSRKDSPRVAKTRFSAGSPFGRNSGPTGRKLSGFRHNIIIFCDTSKYVIIIALICN